MPSATLSFKTYYAAILKESWRSSKGFRILLIAALVWATLRLLMQVVLLTDPVSNQLGIDLQVYLDAAQNFVTRANLYPASLEVLEYHFPYPPMFALLLAPFLWLPTNLAIIVHSILHLLAYYALFVQWGRIFKRWNMKEASKYLILSIPVWLVFSAFWDDMIYLNIYIIMALLSTLLIEAVLREDLLQSSIWLTLVLLAKPQWAFAAAIPLLLGRYRYLFKLLICSLAGYLLLALITALVGGPDYVWGQFKDYVSLLGRLGRDFPWRGPDSGFLGYNHSIKQVFAYFLGNRSTVLLAATVAKSLLLIPLAIITVHRLFHPIRQPESNMTVILESAFCLYLGAFIWLDIVWEASLTVAIFGYLMIKGGARLEKVIAAAIFLPYALLDAWRLISYLAGAPMINDAYLQWDYSIYIPTTMIVILAFYAILAVRLWPWRAALPQKHIAASSKP